MRSQHADGEHNRRTTLFLDGDDDSNSEGGDLSDDEEAFLPLKKRKLITASRRIQSPSASDEERAVSSQNRARSASPAGSLFSVALDEQDVGDGLSSSSNFPTPRPRQRGVPQRQHSLLTFDIHRHKIKVLKGKVRLEVMHADRRAFAVHAQQQERQESPHVALNLESAPPFGDGELTITDYRKNAPLLPPPADARTLLSLAGQEPDDLDDFCEETFDIGDLEPKSSTYLLSSDQLKPTGPRMNPALLERSSLEVPKLEDAIRDRKNNAVLHVVLEMGLESPLQVALVDCHPSNPRLTYMVYNQTKHLADLLLGVPILKLGTMDQVPIDGGGPYAKVTACDPKDKTAVASLKAIYDYLVSLDKDKQMALGYLDEHTIGGSDRSAAISIFPSSNIELCTRMGIPNNSSLIDLPAGELLLMYLEMRQPLPLNDLNPLRCAS